MSWGKANPKDITIEDLEEAEAQFDAEDSIAKSGYGVNIETATIENTDFRRVLFTADKEQLVLMSIAVGESIGLETHPATDQFIRIEQGECRIVMDGNISDAAEGNAIVVPAGTKHNVTNTGDEPLKLYTVYSPPHHPDGLVQKTKPK